MKIGANGIIVFDADTIDIESVESAIFTLKGIGTITKNYPSKEVSFDNGKFFVGLSQEDTITISANKRVRAEAEAQINFKNNQVSKTSITSFVLESTLGTSIIAGNTPSSNVEDLDLKFVNGAIVINGSGVSGADGKSAYELAVENGFEGTVEEWLDSLKGDGSEIDLSNYATKDELANAGVSEEVIERMVQDNLGENVVTQDEKRGYPDYAETERQNVLAQLKQYYNVKNPIVIGFSTDQHLQDVQPEVEENVIPNLRTMRDLTKEFPFDLCVLGGDASSTDTSVPLLNADVLNVSNALDGANCPVIHLVGNHDGRGNIPTIKASAVFGAHRTNALKDNVAITTDESTNCYYDDKAKKIRFIFIISIDLNGYANAKGKAFLLSALETMPNEYEAIIFSHHPMGNLTDDPSTRFDDWNEPLGWGNDLAPYSDKIIACICGHVHDDRHEIKDGILYLSSTCAGFRELNDGTTRTDKLGTVNCTAYDVFVIDRANYTIHCIRYGIGSNRDIVYHIPTYTNVIQTAQDENGEVYNETGYKTGVRLGGSGEEVTGNGTITGFIPVNNGDVVRLKNCNLNGTTNVYTDRLAFYKADHTTLNCQYPYRYIDSSSNLDLILDDDGNVKQFTINSSAIKYVRFSSSTMDENSVVTINEEIN